MTKIIHWDVESVMRYRPGSDDHDWAAEYADLITRPNLLRVVEDIRRNGIQEPVLLGDDGRVWDGHHRILAALILDLETVPVTFGSASSGDDV